MTNNTYTKKTDRNLESWFYDFLKWNVTKELTVQGRPLGWESIGQQQTVPIFSPTEGGRG